MKKGRDQYTQYLFMAGLVAMVAIVALVLSNNGSLEGAASFGEKQMNTFQDVCEDDDPDNDKNVFGTVYLGNKVFQDYCQGDQVVQRECTTGKNVGRLRPVDCDSGYTCKFGVCNPTE